MKKLAEFFALTENERKGFLVLLLLIGLIALVPSVYRMSLKGDVGGLMVDISLLDNVPTGEDRMYAANDAFLEKTEVVTTPKRTLFPFNPNNLPVDQWRAMGFSDRQIRVIKNYESKGGRFRKKEDVAKIYSISERDFERIEPYLRFDAGPVPKSETFPSSRVPKNLDKNLDKTLAETVPDRSERKAPVAVMVEINSADTTAFKLLKGIGSAYAARIVKFRDALGGFHRVEQIKDVYGISDDLFRSIRPNLTLPEEGPSLAKRPVNTLSAAELARHPYISPKEARLIVNYRSQHGNFQSMADLRKIYALREDFLEKIEPYLGFE